MTTPDEIEEVLSVLYHALRAARRRYVIRYLSDTEDKTFSTRELARKVASNELDVPEKQTSGEPYRNAYNALSQTHLPTLAEAGIIVYDPKRQTVCRGSNFDLAALLLNTNTPTVVTVTSLLSSEDVTDGF